MKRLEKQYVTSKAKMSQKTIILLMFLATFFMSIGYASINNVIVSVSGHAGIAIERSIHISVATPLHSTSTVNSLSGTMMNSTVDLSNNSTETFTITISNNTLDDYIFDTVLRDTEQSLFYDNQNITISLNGLNRLDTLTSGSSVTFTATFSFVNGFTPSSPSDYILNSYINFKFRKGYTVTYNNIDTTNKDYDTVALDGTSFAVSFYGDVPYAVKVTSGSTTLTENTHYTYVTDPSNSTHKLLTINNVTNNVTIDRYYHITYFLYGGTANGHPDKYLAGSSTSIGSPTYTKHRFDGWFLNSSYTGSAITTTNELSGDIELHAKWTPIYYITYETNGGTNPSGQIVEYVAPSSETLLAAYHPHDETFGGWYQNSGLTGSSVSTLTGLSGDLNLYAKWTNTINNTTYSDSTYRYTASNVSNDSMSAFDGRQYTQSTANVAINNVHMFLTYTVGNGSKTTTQTCQIASNASGFQTVSNTIELPRSSSSQEITLTLSNPIPAGSSYTISCSHTGDGNNKYRVTSFSFIINE